MKINATVLETERDFQVVNKDGQEWLAYLSDNPSDVTTIKFNYDNGIISALEIHEDIDTEPGIILERLMNTFREFQESQQLGFEKEEENEGRLSDILKPYDPEEIRVRTAFLSAFQVNVDIGKGKIDLNPDFQRNFVWSDAQKSLLIESMLLKIPLPAFYFAEDKKGRFQVVDGLQRLTVISQFLNNKFKLKNLQYLKHLEGKYFSQSEEKRIKADQALEEPYDSRVEGTQLNINIIEASSPLRVKYDIFYRINTGGRPLNRQEIRNCFATERIRILLKQMASAEIFDRSTGYSVKDTRMDAQELALRFCGFLLYRDRYVGDINGFLDEVLEKLSEIPENKLLEIQARYYKSLELSLHLFGQFAFRKVLPDQLMQGARRQFLNKAMFMTWTYILSETDENLVYQTGYGEMASILATELSHNSELLNALTTGTTDRHKLDYVSRSFTELLNIYLYSSND
ncbi:DUF262 domain-containing protein [Pedobacter frigiditerrae]|uniref:DUF262 domain-containing protein n=1 Tax=Pedobacter frigiditerrae TaxID=2530452 RepID=UPI00293115C3|nr:DUF262 domain-containing protein [Pedobacter frigiditerrae]